MNYITESEIEQIALDILHEELGYTVLYAPDLADGAHKEREFSDVVLNKRLRKAIDKLPYYSGRSARRSV